MKSLIILLTLVGLNLTVQASTPGTGIQFFHGSWQQAKAKAKAENKKIFVDFYATWCGPCVWMSKEVFTDANVGSAFNDTILAFKVNAEKEEQDLVNSMNLKAYPTLAIFDSEGTLLSSTTGALDAAKLIQFVSSYKGFEEKEKAYRGEPKNMEKFLAYKEALEFKDKDLVTKEVKDFLEKLPPKDLKTVEAWKLINQYLEDVNSPVVDYIFQNASWYKANGEGFNESMGWFLTTLVSQSIESEQRALLLRAQQLYRNLRKSTNTMSRPESYYNEVFEITYLKNKGDTLNYINRLFALIQKYHSNDASMLAANAQEVIDLRPENKNVMTKCLSMARKAQQLSNTPFTNWVLAYAEQVIAPEKPLDYQKHLFEALRKIPNDQLELSNGNIRLYFENSGKTLSTMYLQFD